MRLLLVSCAVLTVAASAGADVFSLTPVADAFVDSAQATNNYGAAGACGIAAPGSALGEFQSVLRFDVSAAAASLNAAYGAGNWMVQSATLQLTATPPNNPALFNAQAAGQFAASWMQNDSWVEGTGNPMAPTQTGITFASLPGFVGAGDEALGTFSFGGATTGANTYSLALTPGFLADLGAGGPVGFRLSAVGSTIGYLFNSRSFGMAPARPQLTITAVPGPASAILVIGAAFAMPRRRR